MRFIQSLLFVYSLWSPGETVTLSCYQESNPSEDVVDFISPSFPKFLNYDLTCEVSIRLRESYRILRIDFINVTMDGQSAFGNIISPGHCETDMFFFKGLDHWTTPAKCGNLNGYSYVYERKHKKLEDVTLKIVAVMSSEKYRWHVKITQLERSLFQTTSGQPLTTNIKPTRNGRPKILNQSMRNILEENSTGETFIPWLVSIRKKVIPNYVTVQNCPDSVKEGLHVCGGTIINERFVLTAAHCVYGRSRYTPFEELQNWKVVVGDSNVCVDNSKDKVVPSYEYDIQNIIFYYGYDPQLKFHDIAVLQLKSKITFHHHIHPVRLHDKNLSSNWIKINGTISGYGAWDRKSNGYTVVTNATHFKTQHFPFTPKTHNISIASELQCRINDLLFLIRFGHYLHTEMLHYKYADSHNRHICYIERKTRTDVARPRASDSGGPVVSWSGSNGEPELWGVILSAKDRFLDYDAEFYIFLSVYEYHGWIHSVMDTVRM